MSITPLPPALEPLIADPRRSAIYLDVDGTLAPVAERPEDARVSAEARTTVGRLSDLFGQVAILSGRRALVARGLVGIERLEYVGNHGLEFLAPRGEVPESAPGLAAERERVRSFVSDAFGESLRKTGIWVEDKDAIMAFHRRGVPDEERARSLLERVAVQAHAAGLGTHWGRKILEIRPAFSFGKGSAIRALVERSRPQRVFWAGDDWTDLDGFVALRDLVAQGALQGAVCVGVRSAEGPREIVDQADVVVDGPQRLVELLSAMADRVDGGRS